MKRMKRFFVWVMVAGVVGGLAGGVSGVEAKGRQHRNSLRDSSRLEKCGDCPAGRLEGQKVVTKEVLQRKNGIAQEIAQQKGGKKRERIERRGRKEMQGVRSPYAVEKKERIAKVLGTLFSVSPAQENELFSSEALENTAALFESYAFHKVAIREESSGLGKHCSENMGKRREKGYGHPRRGNTEGDSSHQRCILLAVEEIARHLELSENQQKRFVETVEIDQKVLESFIQARKDYLQLCLSGQNLPEKTEVFAKKEAAFKISRFANLNKALATVYPTLSDVQKEKMPTLRDSLQKYMSEKLGGSVGKRARSRNVALPRGRKMQNTSQ